MRKFSKKVLTPLLAAVLAGSTMSACGGSSSDEVSFWVYGDAVRLDMYTRLTEKFNATYGKEHGIEVIISTKPVGSYDQSIQVTAGSKSGPDVFIVRDNLLKQWIHGNYFSTITEEYNAITDIDMGDIMESTISRLKYDRDTLTSNVDDPLYGLPVDAQPTALYYNETMLKKAGIKVISVDEEDMDAWNAGTIADKNGVKKSDLGIPAAHKVPKKGYYRSENPYYYDGDKTKAWVSPTDTEILVFNNRIPMNWDEVEDLAMLFTGVYNPNKETASKPDAQKVTEYGTTTGYFTEWWFNYGWSVGGDCLQDLTGKGEWNFSLLDPNPNYIVKEGKTFTGRTGRVYQAGETLEFTDKMNLTDNEEIPVANGDGDYYHTDGSKVGIWTGVQTEMEKADSALAELPSMEEAFQRYLKLGAARSADIDGDNGLAVSPNPATITANNTAASWFYSGNIALVALTSEYMAAISEQAEKRNFEWDVAPLVVYKQYENPSAPQDDTVAAKGKLAGHSNANSLVVRKDSEKRDKATAFIKWCAGVPGQTLRTSIGFFPNQASLIDQVVFPNGNAPSNVTVFSEALEYQTPGDWWYMPDDAWGKQWCTDLNSLLRNAKITYAQWLTGNYSGSVYDKGVVTRTNLYLASSY